MSADGLPTISDPAEALYDWPDEPPPTIPDRFGAVFPDGAVYDATEGSRMFDQDPEQRARAMAVKIGGRPVRIRTTIEWLS